MSFAPNKSRQAQLTVLYKNSCWSTPSQGNFLQETLPIWGYNVYKLLKNISHSISTTVQLPVSLTKNLEGKWERKKGLKKSLTNSEMLAENARAISVRGIKTHYAGLACLGLLLDCQLTARAAWGFPEVQTNGQAGLKNGTYCSPKPDLQGHWGKTNKNISVGKGIIL